MPVIDALRRGTIGAAASAAAWHGGGHAQTPAPAPVFEETVITNIWANPERCNLGRARHVTLAVLVRDYRAMHGCVAVRGYWWGSALFGHSGDGRAGDALDAGRLATARLGLYGRREIMDSNYANAGLEVTAVGNVGGCETLNGTAMVLGYCHGVREGPYLALAEMYLEH